MITTLHVGIDFSTRSAAICIYDGTFMRWLLFPTGRTLANKRMFAKLKETELVKYSFEKTSLGVTYSETERAKVLESVDLANRIEVALRPYLDRTRKIPGYTFTYAFEGAAYGAKGNSLVDTAMSVGVTRARLADMFGVEQMHVFAPTSIKKYAGAGNYNKVQMRDALIENPKLPNSIRRILMDPSAVSKSGKLAKPLDDLVDSGFIALYLNDHLTNANGDEISTK